jgi:hypothetical protein
MMPRVGSRTAEPSTFLPEDYVDRRFERRTNLFAITLFGVVTLGVVAAFFVTHREWSDVQTYQRAVNVRYAQAAEEIERLRELESQKSELMKKAELTTALIERVPRSILLAELINRMPKRATLLEFELESKRLDTPAVARQVKSKRARSLTGAGAKGDDGEAPEEPTVTAPRFETRVVLIGVAPTHREVARYVASLQNCPLLQHVDLRYSETTIIQDREMNKFRIEAPLRADVDARSIEPLEHPRLAPLEAPGGAPGLSEAASLLGELFGRPSGKER